MLINKKTSKANQTRGLAFNLFFINCNNDKFDDNYIY